MIDPGFINLHAYLPHSLANGPGFRAVVWFQGCTLNCEGCFNPASHTTNNVQIKPITQLAGEILSLPDIEGITISGGEPFQQPEALHELLKLVKQNSNISVILLSGFSLPEIEKIETGKQILSLSDVLIAGRYNQKLRIAGSLCGSSNKTIHLLTSKYQLSDFQNIPDSEIIIMPSSDMVVSGIDPVRVTL